MLPFWCPIILCLLSFCLKKVTWRQKGRGGRTGIKSVVQCFSTSTPAGRANKNPADLVCGSIKTSQTIRGPPFRHHCSVQLLININENTKSHIFQVEQQCWDHPTFTALWESTTELNVFVYSTKQETRGYYALKYFWAHFLHRYWETDKMKQIHWRHKSDSTREICTGTMEFTELDVGPLQ